MEIKRKGDVICEKYRVLNAFPFVYGVFYLAETLTDSAMLPSTCLIHAVEMQQQLDEQIIEGLKSRNEDIFYPIQDVLIEDGVVYQVYEKMEGHLLGIYLLQSAPLPLGEAANIVKMITSHLMKCYDQGYFALVDSHNIVITPKGEIRFLYGGPNHLLPHLTAEEASKGYDEREDVKQVGRLFYTMLTKESISYNWDPSHLPHIAGEIPQELQNVLWRALSPNRFKRPRVHELWKVAYEFADEKPISLSGFYSDSFISPDYIQPLVIVQKKKVLTGKEVPDDGKKYRKRKKISSFKPTFFIVICCLCVIAFIFSIIKIHSASISDQSLAQIVYSDIPNDEQQAMAWYQASVKALEEKKIKEAIDLARKALSANLDQSEYYLHLANLYGMAKEYKKGMQTLKAASKKFPQDASIFDALAVHAYFAKDFPTAKMASDKAVELDSKDPRYLYHQAKIYAALKQYIKAVNILGYAIYMHQDHALYYNDLAVFLAHLNRLDDAIDYAHMAVKYDQGDPTYKITLGALYLKKREQTAKDTHLDPKQKEEALLHWTKKANETFSEVAEQDASLAEPWYYQSMALYYLGEIKQAKQAILKAVEIDPQNPLYQYQLGVTYMAEASKADAITAFRKATILDPHNELFQTGLKKAQAMEVTKRVKK
ncbi:tetratricopeptide repeat protein [Thermoflavimicrobium dichotomicum]|uniref:Tetratricopeptide repeat-containing protein n=1 Tax=Thermoflavimicrobium dichotomicum TaxID=46223 RepID=A0A1I3QU68_9BACL|nr:tetratricopeptide repeat protein [Thermoflavimicrobium dichotomicum]SFJ36791.1 Tetratricopeptide repeat-containing protein [Thermoflavimicrobium dichotomicum]